MITGLAALGLRVIGALYVITAALFEPEAAMGALFDIPTLGLYFLAAHFGVPARVGGAADPIYFLVGSFVWFAGGVVLGLIIKKWLSPNASTSARS
jgi:hypothetical protein